MKQNGFTLIETIVYIALFSILMTSTLITVYELLSSVEINKTALIIQTEGTFINSKLRWAITGASAVTSPSTDRLTVTPATHILFSQFIFYIDSGILYLKRDANPPEALTSADMVVSNFLVTITPATAVLPEYIQIKYQLNQTPFIFEIYR